MAGKKKSKSLPKSSSKKIIAYAAIGIIALAAVSVTAFTPRAPPTNPVDESKNEAIAKFNDMYCGQASAAQNTAFVSEYALPSKCEMPLGVAADAGKVWYVSTKNGTLGSYDPGSGKFEERRVPSWPTRDSPTSFSMSWSAKPDGKGNIWFTDEQQQAIWRFNEADQSFSMFPVAAKLPVSIDFDSNGRIYFAGVQSSSIFVGDPAKMKTGTSDGITEIRLPLDGFSGIEPQRIATGSLAVDRQNGKVWVSMLAFQIKGELIKYDVGASKVERVVDLPPDLNSPVGLTLDSAGMLWGTDHATNIFFRYDESADKLTKFATSIASSRIYGGVDQPDAYTLPYWINYDAGSSTLWFNQHTGNKVSKFDPDKLVLTEYWIPSQNRKWALCPDTPQACGLSNALQISSPAGGKTWFTEWTENKLGVVDGSKALPVSVSAPQEQVTVKRGDSVEIKVDLNSPQGFDGRMLASSTATSNGRLGNSTGIFSEQSVSVPAGGSKEVSFTFTAASDLSPGSQTLMLGAENDEVSVLKAVLVNVL